jgi:DNA-binding MarR family transcriptional regulator
MTSSGNQYSAGDAADAIIDAVLNASRLIVAVSESSIAAVDEAVTVPQFRLLVVLHTGGPMKPSTAAGMLGVNPSNATRMVDRLIAAGLVDRHVNPTTRREMVLELTKAGSNTVTRATQRWCQDIGRIVDDMPERFRTQMVEALEAFNKAGDHRVPKDMHEDSFRLAI